MKARFCSQDKMKDMVDTREREGGERKKRERGREERSKTHVRARDSYSEQSQHLLNHVNKPPNKK